ncbi:MAG: S9 family peptidase [Planctomycetes bacterium]|nr:S9 family peptidase [Planctomycetota bacterium]
MKRSALLLLFLMPMVSLAGEKRRAMKVEDLFRFQRVANPQISPDGKWVVYAVGKVSLQANTTTTNLWIVSTEKGSTPKQLTTSAKADRHPRWSPDGKTILFESNRSGTTQLWSIGIDGGEARQLTRISTGASVGTWSRDGKQIAFMSAVFPEYSTKPFQESDALNKKRNDDNEKNPVKARVFKKLFFRHWDEYVEDKRFHLFVMSFDNGKPGTPRDVTPGDRDAYPTSSTFSIGDDFTFSPDGKFLYFTAVPAKNEAWNTDYDICRVVVSTRVATPRFPTEWETITTGNRAADGAPQFSPDGKWLVYRAQKRPGFEADRWELMVVPANGFDQAPDKRPKPRSITAGFDGSPDDFVWMPDSEHIYFSADDSGKHVYFVTSIKDAKVRTAFVDQNVNGSLSVSRDGKKFAFTRTASHHPNDVHVALQDGKDFDVFNCSQANTKLRAELDLPRPESVTVKGAGGTPMQMWILKPPGFDATKKWPLVYLVHGGPQGAWNDGWSFRWNPQIWAAQGYVVAFPNPRGSTGFGQQYVDEISGDWGGKCYDDLMAGLKHLEEQPYIDTKRMGAAGASFGGYMMNWFAVNTPKFKTLITHCGVWNFDSMYSTTEELWFDEWEHGGPPWGKNRASYEKHSPHKFAKNLGKFKTPMLVIHNDLDFRVPISEGIQLFTTLQRQGVPSRMINFPDEGHWVLGPRNSEFWHREVFAWLKKYVPAGGR